MNAELIAEIGEATKNGDHERVIELTRRALDTGLPIERIIQDGFIATMAVVGDDFADGRLYIPEMLFAAAAMQAGMSVLKPLLVGTQVASLARVIIGTVQGDLHDIGKNLVGIMLEGGGAEVIDLGVDVSPEKFVTAVTQHKAQIVALSALLTTTMPGMSKTIRALEEAGLRDSVKVLVGGAPVTDAFARHIGADGYGADAAQAVKLVKSFVK
jgi:5-methyltetrahydrofolate--homocysteine methyltransferase